MCRSATVLTSIASVFKSYSPLGDPRLRRKLFDIDIGLDRIHLLQYSHSLMNELHPLLLILHIISLLYHVKFKISIRYRMIHQIQKCISAVFLDEFIWLLTIRHLEDPCPAAFPVQDIKTAKCCVLSCLVGIV